MRILFTLLSFVIIAAGCKTPSYFNNANDLLNRNCELYLINGTKIDGKLTVQFEEGHSVDKYLKIVTVAKEEKKILITDILYYIYNNEFYYPKDINLEAYEIPLRNKLYTPNVSNILFLKRLTKDSAKLQLFELFQSRLKSTDGFDHYDYYISFRDDNRFIAWSTRGKKFFPNFEEKMSAIVSDCRLLADKIKQKENGYSVRQVSVDGKKNDVIRKIVEEYNGCK